MNQGHTRPGYETGMKLVYDAHTKRMVVSFRARLTVLPATYESEQEAIQAGEQFCRQHGWKPETATANHGVLRRVWD